MLDQKDLIHNTEWDILCILDACRFDMFEDLYPRWLKGKLTKVKTAGVETSLWLKETWTDYYDLIYFSANPYINSQGYMARHIFRATEHFSEIVNVWETGWNNEFGTVFPIEMNKAVMKKRIDKRAVIHYVQPHPPFIGRSGLYRGAWAEGRFRGRILQLPKRKLGRKRQLGDVSQRDAYIETLDLVLQRVSELVPHLKGKIIVSADHGELLGEVGKWGHLRDFDHPLLLEVPWFEVEKE